MRVPAHRPRRPFRLRGVDRARGACDRHAPSTSKQTPVPAAIPLELQLHVVPHFSAGIFHAAHSRAGPACAPATIRLSLTIQDNTMTRFTIDAHETETVSRDEGVRLVEVDKQAWSRSWSAQRAQREGIRPNDMQWAVFAYLRRSCIEHGLPGSARPMAAVLNQRFAVQGGSRYLHGLFPGGPVTRGRRLAYVRTPASATDVSFGTSY